MKKNGIIFIRVVFICSLVITIGGCGDLKERLEGAETEVIKLTNENTVLKQKMESLESKIQRTTDEINQLESQCADLRSASEKLKAKNKKILAKYVNLEKSREKLKTELEDSKERNKELNETIEALRLKISAPESEEIRPKDQEMESTTTAPQERSEETYSQAGDQTKTEPKEIAQDESPTPCDMVINFMKSSSRAIRDLKGDERAKELERIAADYDPKMEGAPQEAIDAAKKWVINVSKTWDKGSSEGIFRTLDLRNKALKACGISPENAGF